MIKSTLVAALAASVAAAPNYKLRVPRDEDSHVLEPRAYNSTLEAYIEKEYQIALAGALANIGGTNGSIVPGADPGIVVASPSTVNPDYFYTWTRDSALTQMMITDELIFGTQMVGNNSLQVVVEQYTTAQAQLQTVTNPSGSLWPAGLGLGEPKFYTNMTRFNGAWGRPQNDGPALRATTMMEIANAIFMRNPQAAQIVSTIYWPQILNDLRYVGQYWNTTSYDLWEEVNGNSFFTTTAQHRALVEGSLLAARINQTCEPCQQASNILCFLNNYFFNSTGNYILADINTNQVTRSGINADPILAAMHVFDINATCNDGAIQPCNSKALATHKVWVDSFRNLYPINHNASTGAVACGRYPEDNYYGSGSNGLANPWYITTLAAAEMLYDAAAQFSQAGSITIDNISLDFWRQLSPNITTGTYSDYSSVNNLLQGMRDYADGFVGVVETYTPPNGTLNEQFNKTTGEPVSAIALTWSFAAFVTMTERRNGQYPPSWGANSTLGNNVTQKCSIGSYNSTFQYQPDIAAGAMNVTEDVCLTNVLFQLQYVTGADENTYIVGNTSLFGNTLDNNTDVIQVLRTGNYTPETPKWIEPAWVPAGVPIAYKYVLANSSSGSFTYENITRYVTPPACGNNTEEILYSIGSFPPH